MVSNLGFTYMEAVVLRFSCCDIPWSSTVVLTVLIVLALFFNGFVAFGNMFAMFVTSSQQSADYSDLSKVAENLKSTKF